MAVWMMSMCYPLLVEKPQLAGGNLPCLSHLYRTTVIGKSNTSPYDRPTDRQDDKVASRLIDHESSTRTAMPHKDYAKRL